jgi:hypothetical protein
MFCDRATKRSVGAGVGRRRQSDSTRSCAAPSTACSADANWWRHRAWRRIRRYLEHRSVEHPRVEHRSAEHPRVEHRSAEHQPAECWPARPDPPPFDLRRRPHQSYRDGSAGRSDEVYPHRRQNHQP